MAEVSGPIFHADAAVEIMLNGISRSIADELRTRWLINLDSSIRVNRHVYTSNVVAQRDPDGWRVTDGGVIYGPWLEGTGSRNRTTRFKGYASLRRAAQDMEGRADIIAEHNVAQFCAEMNA